MAMHPDIKVALTQVGDRLRQAKPHIENTADPAAQKALRSLHEGLTQLASAFWVDDERPQDDETLQNGEPNKK